MKSRIIIGAATALALGLSGAALADAAGEKQQEGQKNEPTQQPMEGYQGQHTQPQPQQAPKAAAAQLDAVKLASLNEVDIKNLQQELKTLGYYKADIDGVVGPQTRAALIQFFSEQVRLMGQGKISEAALASFGWNQSDIQRVRGVDRANEKAAPEHEKAAPEKGDTRE